MTIDTSDVATLTHDSQSRFERLGFVMVVGLAVIWTVLPAVLYLAPPIDIVESGMWGREWLIGSYKHPALPSWALEIARIVSGGTIGWSAYAVSALFNAATLGLTFLLVRELVGWQIAVVSTLALMSVEHFTWRAPEFNHDIAQMPFWVATIFFMWRAVERGGLVWWILLGFVAAGGLYAKLSHAVILLVVFGWLLWDRKARLYFATPGPWVAAVVFGVLVYPLLRWLLATNFYGIGFAQERGGQPGITSSLLTCGGILLVLTPAMLTLWLGGCIGRETLQHDQLSTWQVTSPSHGRYFLTCMTGAPFAVAFILALLARTGLRQDWLAPMLCLVPATLAAWLGSPITAAAITRTTIVAAVVALTIVTLYTGVVLADRVIPNKNLMRVNWPQQEIASRLTADWAKQTGRPLKIVAGGDWIAGLIALNNQDNPSIFRNGDFRHSPWITPQRLTRDGALIVWVETGSGPPKELMAIGGNRPVLRESFNTPRLRTGVGLNVDYMIVPPSP